MIEKYFISDKVYFFMYVNLFVSHFFFFFCDQYFWIALINFKNYLIRKFWDTPVSQVRIFIFFSLFKENCMNKFKKIIPNWLFRSLKVHMVIEMHTSMSQLEERTWHNALKIMMCIREYPNMLSIYLLTSPDQPVGWGDRKSVV